MQYRRIFINDFKWNNLSSKILHQFSQSWLLYHFIFYMHLRLMRSSCIQQTAFQVKLNIDVDVNFLKLILLASQLRTVGYSFQLFQCIQCWIICAEIVNAGVFRGISQTTIKSKGILEFQCFLSWYAFYINVSVDCLINYEIKWI